jgi:hypothetical protein
VHCVAVECTQLTSLRRRGIYLRKLDCGFIRFLEIEANVNSLNSGPNIPSQKRGLAWPGPQKRECIWAREEAQTEQTILETESHSLDVLDSKYTIYFPLTGVRAKTLSSSEFSSIFKFALDLDDLRTGDQYPARILNCRFYHLLLRR